MKNKYIIQDWAGNLMFSGQAFDTFEDGWEFIYIKLHEHFGENIDEDCFGEYYVVNERYL